MTGKFIPIDAEGTLTRKPPSTAGIGQSTLEAMLTAAADAVSGIGPEFERYGQKTWELQQRLCQGRFHLAVLGQFKRGKSTLLNALVGESILPVGVIPLTAAPTFMQFGENPQIHIRYMDGRKAETFAGASTAERNAFLAHFVTESENPGNSAGVAEVEVDLPAPILSGGVVLIDTPGIGSTFRHNTAATLHFLQQCDAALFLISADPPITEVELAFLKQVREKVPRLFFVMNKIDYLDERELEEALGFYRGVLAEHLGKNDDPTVFSVSAREGIRAKEAGDSARWQTCGMARLESFLIDYLAREKQDALAEAVSRRAADLLDGVLMEAEIALQALQLPRQELEEKIGLFESALKQAESERRLIQDVLAGDKKRVSAFVEDQAAQLHREAEQFLKDIMNRGAAASGCGRFSKPAIADAWAEAIPAFFEAQQENLNEQVKAYLLECLTPHEQRLARLEETLRRTAADLFQVPYRSLQPEEALEIKRRPYWVLNTWNTDALPALKSAEQRRDELVRRNVENIRWAMLQNLNVSFARFAARVRDRLAETVAATKGAMNAAHARKKAHGGNLEAEVARMADAIGVVAAMKADIAGQKGKRS
ncbi:MAG: dynamin family protein [Desulfobacterales bacterium]|jgi:GTP-binding protein EngB required for normal cell division